MCCGDSGVLQSLKKLSLGLAGAGLVGAPLVWLVECTSPITDQELDEFAAYGDALGPSKVRILFPSALAVIFSLQSLLSLLDA